MGLPAYGDRKVKKQQLQIYYSPLLLLLIIAGSIFIIESLIMAILQYLPHEPTVFYVFLDSTMLLLVLSPLLYFFIFRPLLSHITERKKVEDDIRRERDRSNQYLDVAGVMFVAINTEGEVTLVNQKGCDILGYDENEIIGKDWFENFLPEEVRDEVKSISEKILAGELESAEFFENPVLTKGGEERIIAWHNSILKDERGGVAGHLSSGDDVTERRKMEEELQKIQKLESLGILAGGIAHDYNNLLTVIMANISFALQVEDPEIRVYKDKPDGAVLESLMDAERATLRAKDLTNQLKTFSSGGGAMKELVSDLEALITEEVDFALRGSNIRCDYSVPDDLWPVEVDKGQINQVLQNLVINAGQAMPDGGVMKVKAENSTVAEGELLHLKAGRYVKITVEDQGNGIPKEILTKIFDPYFTTKETGSGLGLAIAYSIIKKHDGHISFESDIRVGTICTIYLPSTEKMAIDMGEKELPIAGSRCGGSKILVNLFTGGKVLIMDDEELVRNTAGRILSKAGYEVESAKDGSEALNLYMEAKLSGRSFDLVLMDLTIPGGLGGRETIKELLEFDPEAKAIVTSGYSNDTIMEDFKEYGFKGVIAKPYSTVELRRVLHEVIADTMEQAV